MAPYQGNWRSNKFRVKDSTEFATWLESWPTVMHRAWKDNMVRITANHEEWGGIPYYKQDENDEFIIDGVDFLSELAEYVDDTSVCIILQTGTNFGTVVDGYAFAITGGDGPLADRFMELSLLDIENQAKRKFGKRPIPFNEEN